MNHTKASRLRRLAELGLGSYVLPQFSISERELGSRSEEIRQALVAVLGQGPYAVRSSAVDEDQTESQAGKYLSLLNVQSENLEKSIREVFSSYTTSNPDNQVLVQPFVQDAINSGVVFTVEPNLGAPYLTVNWTSGEDTTAITSGAKNGDSLVIFDGHLDAPQDIGDFRLKELLDTVKKVQNIDSGKSLDIEWIQTKEATFILQVRPLSHAQSRVPISEISLELESLKRRIWNLQKRHPYLAGETTIFGVMPDWNPAELIGIRPNTLAFSLFRELISDSIWAYERGNLGYRNLRSFPLVMDFAGHPYVDLRVSLNSLLPADINDELAAKLVDYYILKLNANPTLHDKIEFEVVLSCYSFDWDSNQPELDQFLSRSEQQELLDSLVRLTRNVITGERYGLREIQKKQDQLSGKYEAISNGNLDPIGRAFWFLEDCKRHGTLPFAGIARLAFIATKLLRSLVQANIVFEDELLAFTSRLETRTSKMVQDQAKMTREEFVSVYGHLRPGTFDITAPNYSNAFDSYFPSFGQSSQDPGQEGFRELADSFEYKVRRFLPGSELAVSGELFLSFCSEAIIAREETKFLFSRHVSAALESIAELAESLGFQRADASHINVQSIQDSYKNPGDLVKRVHQDIEIGVRAEAISHSITLPTLIRNPDEVTCFRVSDSVPNFVTLLNVSGEVVVLESPSQDLSGKIVLIESADPGFDWIFTRGISGMITAWGGANSHMSIRAKELGIPAAIGVGEAMYLELSRARSCRLDCRNKRIELMS
jgi:phosphohistidine swiveling domain-containing protein